MDLAKAYHAFAKMMYPAAIRIAERYHVNRYVTEALQAVQKFVQKQLAPFSKKDLKQYLRILGKRRDQLKNDEKIACTDCFNTPKFCIKSTVGKKPLSKGMTVGPRINWRKKALDVD
ncbi:transposase [Lysinibacillus sp. FSL H8-0500]|uniref:transposase n=1 Tax=Lysinibacillus sp. FSL H8-0500 TaxID=2921393 RepID=UPI0031016696